MKTPGFTHPPLALVGIALIAAVGILVAVAALTPADPKVFGSSPPGSEPLPRLATPAPAVPPSFRSEGPSPADPAISPRDETPRGTELPVSSGRIAFPRPSIEESLRIPPGVRKLPWKGVLLHGGVDACPAPRAPNGIRSFHFRIERGVLTASGEEILAGEALEVLPRWREQRAAVNFGDPQIAVDEGPWIGVLVDGAMAQGDMTDGQLRTLVDLVLSLERGGFLEAPVVRCHRELESCRCPGSGIRLEEIERWLLILGS